MRVSLGHSTDTTAGCTEWSVLLDDELDSFDPLRTSDMCAMARDLFRTLEGALVPITCAGADR